MTTVLNTIAKKWPHFVTKWNVIQEFSSPGYPRHNGLSEIAVKQVKYLLMKCNEDFHEFQSCLQEWRNTPSHTGFAPSQLFICRRMRCKLPVLPELCLIDAEKAIIGAEERKKAHKKLCEEQGGRELKPLLPGQRVLVQQLRGVGKKPRWDNAGTVVSQNESGQSYYIDLDTGEHLLRNRVYLRELPADADILRIEAIHEKVSKAPRRSERIAAQASL